MNLPEKIVAVHLALDEAGIDHAFGGALALAWCTERARGTIDIDLNVFVPPDMVERVLAGLPDPIHWGDDAVNAIRRDGQVRLWWDTTPVDLFFNTTDFHEHLSDRVRHEPFLGVDVPFLACRDLAVFKAFFDRPRDWADLAEMADAGSLDIEAVLGVLVHYLGGDDPRVARLHSLA